MRVARPRSCSGRPHRQRRRALVGTRPGRVDLPLLGLGFALRPRVSNVGRTALQRDPRSGDSRRRSGRADVALSSRSRSPRVRSSSIGS